MTVNAQQEFDALLDFFRAQRANPPTEFTHASGLIDSPGIFSVDRLQEHVNNPLIAPPWFTLVDGGKPVSLESACMYKEVQGHNLVFVDKARVNQALDNGAALVLEGIDILDASINAFVGRLEEALPCALCNCVAFFSQRGNEAYAGHLDSDDVLVIQVSGEKLWNLHEPQQRRFVDTTHFTPAQMGRRIKQLTMRPGDALYVRAGVPHVCQTTGSHSLHLAFDLIDNTPNVRQITARANEIYDQACEDSHAAPERVMQRYVQLLESPQFRRFVSDATRGVSNDARQFRRCIGRSSGVTALSKYR